VQFHQLLFKHRYNLLIFFLILGAFLIRITYITEIPHYIDNAYPMWQALLTLDRGIFPLTGQMSSVGFANPPITGYLYLPIMGLTRSPLAVYVIVIFLNSLGIWFCYRLTKDLFGEKAALIAAWLMAVNPWLIEYSRFTWVQGLMPFFMTLLAWLFYPLLLGKVTHRFRRTTAVMLLMTLIAGTYLLAFLVVLPVSILMLIFYKRIAWHGVLIGAVAFILMFGLYTIGILTETQTNAGFMDEVTSSSATLNTVALGHATRFVTGDSYSLRIENSPENFHTLEQILQFPMLAAFLTGVGFAVYAIWKQIPIKRDLAVILFVWWTLTILPLSYNAQPVQVHYQMVTFPAGYIFAAWGCSFLLNHRFTWVIPFVILIPFSFVMINTSLRYTSQQAEQRMNQSLVRPPVGIGQEVGRKITEYLPEDGVVYIDSPQEVIMSLAGTLFPMVRYNWQIPVTFIPQEGGVYVVMIKEGEVLPPEPLFSTPVDAFQTENGMQFAFYTYSSTMIDLETIGKSVNIPSQQGLKFLRYTLTSNQRGNNWTLTTYWKIEKIPEIFYNFGLFAHLIRDDNTTVIDGAVVPDSLRRIGDIHIHHLRFNTRQMPFKLRIGQYDAVRNESLIFHLPDGGTVTFIEILGESTSAR
jgi:hypothetical protein